MLYKLHHRHGKLGSYLGFKFYALSFVSVCKSYFSVVFFQIINNFKILLFILYFLLSF